MPWRLAGLVGTLIFVSAAPAAATTYCVAPATGCGGGQQPTLAAGLSAALANSGADVVQLGATTYNDGPWSYSDGTGTNPVTVRGAGALNSQLVSFTSGATLSLTNGSVDNAVIANGTSGGVGLSLQVGTLSNSIVQVPANGRGVDAVLAVIEESAIVPVSSGGGHTAVLADNSTIRHTSISTTNGIEVNNPPVNVRRSTIVTQGYGLQSPWSSTSISDSLIVLNDPTAVGVQGICDLAIGTITIDAQNLTVTGAGSGGIAFRSIGGQGCGGHVAVSSTLVHNVGTTVDCAPGIGSASVAVSYSDVDLAGPGKVTGNCNGGAVDAGNNFLADPKLATPATLSPVPRYDSPLIDAGDPAPPGQPTDLPGLPRAVNGRRDVGAFEYGRRAPELSVASSPATPAAGVPVTFTATTSDLDLGDAVAVAWSFDDGATAAGNEVSHAFATAGVHTATATATDSAGVTTVRSATVTVESPNQGQDKIAPETQLTKQPKKQTSKRKAVFAFSSSESGSSFECKLDKGEFDPCSSPFKKKVKAGRKPITHKFSVVAIDSAGNRDATPASYSWKVKPKAKK